jgi:hypothetical protein
MNNFLLKILAVVTLVIFAPLALVFGLIAALFLLQQFLSGLNPLNWFSGSGADWIFGGGSEGSASNYFGFMISAALAFIFWSVTKWSYETLRKKSDRT